MRRTKLIDKQLYKKIAGCCRICKNHTPDLLDVHRIIPGANGGRYTDDNVVALCAICHRKVHVSKTIVIDRWYSSTAGYLLRIIDDGTERFV